MKSFDIYSKAYGGQQGESLFHTPLLPAHNKKSAETFYNRVSEIANYIFSFNDDRILVIHGALLIESSIDDLMGEIMIKYSNKDFNFSVKIKLAKALSIIPSHLLDSADNIRQTRNDFAHKLDLKDLSKDPSKVRIARQHVKKMLKEDINGMSDTEVFQNLILNTAAGIQVYRPGLQLLNVTIRSAEFLRQLEEKAIYFDKLGK